ncbi:MAG: hypothetical protein K940chlam3_01193, partial [Chlamydiae bacterium]|nr:hypothetical protein [Chlamydiota bacterium]
MTNLISRHKRWLFPLLGLALLAPFTPYLDLTISNYFYNADETSFTNNAFYSFVYHYAQLPGFIVFGCAMVALIASYFKKSLKKHRNTILVLVLAMAMGPGLIINVFLKPGWGRPRPRQVIEFSGPEAYRAFYSPNFGAYTSDKYKSFPSGHASMGFYFFVLAVMGARMRNRPLVFAGYSIAMILGIILGITRIAQGGHFFSDIVVAA